MASYSQGDVVVVPFPYTDRGTRQRRPALVVSRGAIGENAALLWVAMITSAENRPWRDDDVPLDEDYATSGLPAPSVIRPIKLTTIEARYSERIGAVPAQRLQQVLAILRSAIG